MIVPGNQMAGHSVRTFYKFVRLENHELLRKPLLDVMREADVLGTVLLASEGVNGTISGSRSGTSDVLDWLKSDERLFDLEHRESCAGHSPFHRRKVKLKKEIVTLGVEGLDPASVTGTYVDPADWNKLISDPEVLIVDTRNEYEVNIGSFRNAIDPGLRTFRELPEFVARHLDRDQHRKVAMFCTGGIRCEKSTAYLKHQGFDEVYHLHGGILNYLEQVPRENSLWQGECFVFDDRVSVDHHLNEGNYEQCHACRTPVSEADRASPEYEHGISCPHCSGNLTDQQRERFGERERQVKLAEKRGEPHIGSAARDVGADRKIRKILDKKRQRDLFARSQG